MRLPVCISTLMIGLGLVGLLPDIAAFGQTTDDVDVLRTDNLVAWCIVPFDAKKRSPAERALMLKEIGISRCAYDWREEHVPTFEQEIIEYRKQGIEYFAFWSVHNEAFRLFEKYDLHPQIWQTMAESGGETPDEKIEAAAQQMLPLAKRTGELQCKLGLYNHGGWGGEPENMVAVCRRLRELGQEHVGIVYNFHHGHGHIDDWTESFEIMKAYLLCLNLNGMNTDAEPKILGIGKGEHELEMIRIAIDGGYDGPIGILDHREQLDARESLRENLDGLQRIRDRLRSNSDWMQFRGPGGGGECLTADPLPSDLNFGQSLLWKVAVPEGHSSPNVVGDLIILTGYDGQQLIVLALDRRDGTTQWRRAIDVPAIEKVYHHGPATPTAVSDGSHVFVVFGSYGVLSYDLEGNENWRKEWPIAENLSGTAASPILEDEKLIVLGSDQKQGMLRAYNDRQLDKAETEPNRSVLSRPDADGEGDHPLRIFFGMLDQNRDGVISETEWPRMQGWVDTFEHANGFLALRLGESSQAPELFWKQEDAVPECPTPVCQDGILFAVRNGGVLTCLDTASGEVAFQGRLLPGGPYYSSPVLGDGKIWFASARGEVSVITATATPKLLSSVDLKEPVWATPALANGTVFVRSKNSLWAFGKKPIE